ncbi:unnamed protein product [Boreogadus saida]
MNETPQSSGEEHQGSCVCSPEGLPPLPKSLSGFLTSSGGSWRDMGKVQSTRVRVGVDLSQAGACGDASTGSLCKHVGLDGALALLRKEMVGVRQLDVSLLCQLWSQYEAVQEYKGSSLLSEQSYNAEDNDYSEDDDEKDDEEDGDMETAASSSPDSCLPLPPPSGSSND